MSKCRATVWFCINLVYLIDFAPERTLPLYEQFANNLLIGTTNGGGTTEIRKENIQQLLNFFPVIAEDREGKMVAIDVEQVLTIPKAFKAREVVTKGFMSNLLFQNVSGIFASQGAREILEQLKPTEEGKNLKKPKIDTKNVTVDENGHAVVSDELVINKANATFGKKVFQEVVGTTQILPSPQHSTKEANDHQDHEVRRIITSTFKEAVVEQAQPLGAELSVSKKAVEHIVTTNANELQKEIEKVQLTQRIELTRMEEEYKEKIEELLGEPESEEKSEKIIEAKEQYEIHKKELALNQKEELVETVTKKTEELTKKTTQELYQKAEDKKKTTVEDDVRARLRGFARTIPSFLMAYGNKNTTLATFDTTIKDAVFQEVTGITLEQFRKLRDTFQFFDEVVFNESVKEFLKKKEELGNYFDETQEEDIFDYIPPQQTNQIFTPKRVVKMMVDQLEAEDPTLFQQPDKTFADLYMKSGLYITEIVTRLYKGLEEKIPDKDERIKHILENQVYGFAPTEIIYHIARNFIFGFDDRAKNISDAHIVHLDTTPYAKGEGDLEKKCDELFGGENNEI